MTQPDAPARRVVVVGAGIAGLTCAYRLSRLPATTGSALEVMLYEASDRTGGKVRTSEIAGIPVDEGIDGFLARVPAAVGLCRELGLGERLTSPAGGGAFVYCYGALHRFPEGLVLGVPTDLDALAAWGVISSAGVERARQDLTAPADGPPPGTDESVGALVRRRLGDEVFETLVAPLLSGVNAGDADRLSVAGGAAQFAAARADGPSLIEGLRRQRAAAAAAVAASGGPPPPVFHGLVGGTQSLTDALTAALPAGSVHTGVAVTALRPEGDGVALDVDGRTEHADAVVLAVPSFAAAPLVRPFDAALADDLASLEWASVALVTFAVRRSAIDHPLDGSGFLVAEAEGLLMTACSFGSSKWAHWTAPAVAGDDDVVILRVSAGRHHDPRAAELDDDKLVAQLQGELGATIGLHDDPLAVRVTRWDRALPQYRPGHLDRARAWKTRAAAHGVYLTGASYLGLGLPACVTDAEATAAAVAERLRL
jgi:oxygen-dependent protoporphyrinogen oxidase